MAVVVGNLLAKFVDYTPMLLGEDRLRRRGDRLVVVPRQLDEIAREVDTTTFHGLKGSQAMAPSRSERYCASPFHRRSLPSGTYFASTSLHTSLNSNPLVPA